MNSPTIPLRQVLALTALLILLAALPPVLQANESVYSSVLPIIISLPGELFVDDEDSLRAAIEIANKAGQFPRIELTADIELTAPLPVLHNPRAGTATIAGNNHTLDGNRVGSVLAIGADTTAVIERLTITDGSGSSGVYSECGGGIYNEGRLTLRQSRVAGNWARRGGGICVWSPQPTPATLTLEDSIVSANQAFMFGGGIYADSDKGTIEVNISRSLLQANTAKLRGGGIFAYSDRNAWLTLNVNNSTLSGNQALNFEGGAIFSATTSGSITTNISRSTIAFNSAADGAGLYHEGSSYGGGAAQAIIKNSTFSTNVSSGYGGAISNVDTSFLGLGAELGEWLTAGPVPQGAIGGAHMQLLYSTVTGNRANRGSGILNEARLQATGSIIAGNEAIGRDCWLPISSDGYNLDGDGSCDLDQPTDLPHGQADLQPLALVPPGDTATHPLGPQSQALDRIPSGAFGCNPATDTDQRGVARPQPLGGLCDSGAYEADKR